jgi:ATP:ADP antiporter, AAA family
MFERTATKAPLDPNRSPLEKVLSIFADVHKGEGATALLLTFNVFILLTCYYLLKTAREPLILASGAEVKSYSSAGQALLLIPVTHLYGKLAERVGRMRLITVVTLFFAVNLLLFFLAGKAHVPHVGVAFFLWVGIFSLMIVAQFWSFAADIYKQEQGKRLFAILGIGGTVGAVVGSGIARALVKPLGPFGLMLVAAGFLLFALGITFVVQKREAANGNDGSAGKDDGSAGKDDGSADKKQTSPLGKGGGFAMLRKDRYLLLLGTLSFFLNWVNTSGEYILDRTLLEVAHARIPEGVDAAALTATFIGEFKSSYFLWINTTSVLLQLFVVSRVIKHLVCASRY